MTFMYCMKPQSHDQQEKKFCVKGVGRDPYSEVTQRWWNPVLGRFSEADKASSLELVIPWDGGWGLDDLQKVPSNLIY